MDINVITITGNLTKDITVRNVSYGTGDNKVETKVANFSIGCDYRKDKVVYPNCVAWGRTAEFMEQYLNCKGMGVIITGHLVDDSYTDANGQKQYRLAIAVDQLKPLNVKADESPWA